jgi:hypothetical protein
MTVCTERNVYTGQEWDVCARHNTPEHIGDTQTQMGQHEGRCDFCDRPQPKAPRPEPAVDRYGNRGLSLSQFAGYKIEPSIRD